MRGFSWAIVFIEATAVLTPVSLGTGTALDNRDGAITPSASPTGPFALGTHSITWSATDMAGNTGTATQTVTVEDTTPPVLTLPADVTESSLSAPMAISIGNATATDIFEPVVVTNDAPAQYPFGVTLVTWTATDANGNTSTATQNVTLERLNWRDMSWRERLRYLINLWRRSLFG